jgi:ubiquinone/menaquinone biosynthesis C-methylase UbiE
VAERAIDPDYLRYQYDDAERLRIRQEAHARWSERTVDFHGWVLEHVAPRAGMRVVDVGCGNGLYHPRLAAAGARVVGVDHSLGMLRAAPATWRVVAGAEGLPLRSASFDAALCNHVLYHVPEMERALRELRRVLVSGGRVVIATNAADFAAELHALHAEAARALGLATDESMAARFTLDHLPLVARVFPNARVERLANAFAFPDADSALRYYASGPIDGLRELPADGSHRAPLLARVGARVAEIVARAGVFRVSKSVGCFVATA